MMLRTDVHAPTFMAVIAALLLLPATAAAQSGPTFEGLSERADRADLEPALVQTVLERARQRGLRAEEAARLVEPGLALAEDGLPAAPALEKALEGLAKGVPVARIHPVVGELATGTREVGRFVREWARREEVAAMLGAESDADRSAVAEAVIESGARARMQGAPQALVEEFLTDLPGRTTRRPVEGSTIADAVRALPDVPAGGGAGRGVARLLTEAVDAGVSGETMRQIPGALRTASRQSGRPVGALARAAAAQMGAGEGASQVLATLFEGGTPGVGPPDGAPGDAPTPPGQDLPPETGPPGDDVGTAGESPGPPGSNPGENSPPGNGPPSDGPPAGGGSQ